jgi:bifunctional DNA-binding transcriptional regulator/antitoxin component of YhaV-PrlF toxin-antitoxin module
MSLSMKRRTLPPSFFSKVSGTSQTVILREVRERLQLKPSDTLRHRLTSEGVLLDKAPASDAEDPFVAFSEGRASPTRRHASNFDASRTAALSEDYLAARVRSRRIHLQKRDLCA